ncbi:hypothetical protein AAFN86_19610 [Roseomonas sp. CAU 1739]|uniref:hypothetical protein n=1 Tax=Roseomonas sp. CAU 1739 TaxID=3140364 RepID=UPI00325BFEC6
MDQPFAVEFDLAEPIVMDHGINLAGLLARRIYDLGDDDPLPKVPLKSVDGIFAGSDLLAVGPGLEFSLPFVRSLRPTAMQHDLALHDRRGKRMTQITLRDERKNLLDHRRAISVPLVVAFGTGDAGQVERLLRGITHIGAKRSGGHGAVEAFRITQLDHPHAGFANRDGKPTRAVPLPVWQSMNLPPAPVRYLVARLPRWSAPREPCVGPRDWRIEFETLDREFGL